MGADHFDRRLCVAIAVADTYCDFHTNRDSNGNSNSHVYSDCHSYVHTDSDGNRYCHGDSDAYCNSYSYRHSRGHDHGARPGSGLDRIEK